MKRKAAALALGTILLGLLSFAACTGDDPSVSTDAGPDGAIESGPGSESGTADTGAPDTGEDVDAGRCNPDAAFAAPVLLPNVNALGDGGAGTEANDFSAGLAPDELTLYLTSSRNNPASGTRDLFVATRGSRDVEFDAPAAFSNAGVEQGGDHPSLTENGLSIYFASSTDLLVGTRPSTSAVFGTLTTLNISSGQDNQPFILPDGNTLFFVSSRAPSQNNDIWQATLQSDGGFDPPARLAELASPTLDVAPAVTPDGLVMFFASDRPLPDGGVPGLGGFAVWTASRKSAVAVFGTPAFVPEVSSASPDLPMWISPDRCVLYLVSTRSAGGHGHIYRATRGR